MPPSAHDGAKSDTHASIDQDGSALKTQPNESTTLEGRNSAATNALDRGKDDFKARLNGGAFGGLQPAVEKHTLSNEVYDVQNFYWKRGRAQGIARSDLFMNITLAIIALNAIYIGVDADLNDAATLSGAAWPFQLMEHAFCIFFTFEWCVRFCAFEVKRNCLRDNWFKFDSMLVLLMWLETWLLPLIMLFLNGGAEAVPLPTGPLRLLRLLRLSRMAKLLRYFPELITMVKGMWKASRAVGSSLFMVTMLIYVFAIVLHMAMHGEQSLSQDYFGSLGRCMWSLFIYGTLCDSVGTFLTEMLLLGTANAVVAVILSLMFILLSAMTVMNMLIGVLCEVVSGVAQAEKEEAAINLVKDEILVMLKHFDADASGTISQSELQSVMADPHAVAVLEALDVDTEYLTELQDMLYESEDAVITIEDVMQLILRTRGELSVTVSHMVHGQHFTRWSFRAAMRKQQQYLDEKLHMMTSQTLAYMDRKFQTLACRDANSHGELKSQNVKSHGELKESIDGISSL
eukprot:TRINITY_DN6213_c0_g1_i1.p1 TRINITY_DN6213_c0_g1~~TRINITY_DN6213_c0_g1_i1.p1  ORF type:complete len:602 (-),score=97.91 TRINITY_DN6213_c0_g1_i1:168-1715(-)